MRLAILFLLLASPAWGQDYPPESAPIPSPELVLTALGFLSFDPVPVAEDGEPVTIDYLCARLVGTADLCAAGRARLQETLTNSLQGHVTVRTITTMQSTYASDGVMTNDITRVSARTDGFADDIMAERERVGADCVMVISTAGDSCGLAYLMSGATSCIAIVSQGCLGNSSYEHEAGHNAGLSHDQPNTSSGGYAGTSYGFCAGCGHKDVLVYPSPCGGSRIARFSNPTQFCPFHPAVPFGSAIANGALAWRSRAPFMAGFRTAVASPVRKPARPVRARVEPTL